MTNSAFVMFQTDAIFGEQAASSSSNGSSPSAALTPCPAGDQGLECRRAEARRSVDCPRGESPSAVTYSDPRATSRFRVFPHCRPTCFIVRGVPLTAAPEYRVAKIARATGFPLFPRSFARAFYARPLGAILSLFAFVEGSPYRCARPAFNFKVRAENARRKSAGA